VTLPPKRKRMGVVPGCDLLGMPEVVPVLPDAQYSLPEAVGRFIDRIVLSRDALHPLADALCRLSEGTWLRADAIVRPLRAAAVARLALVGDDAPADDDAATAAGSSAPSSDSEPRRRAWLWGDSDAPSPTAGRRTQLALDPSPCFLDLVFRLQRRGWRCWQCV
jgi:hypothetical protein